MPVRLLRASLLVVLCAGIYGCSSGPAFTISGKVTSGGTPVGGAEVRFHPSAAPKETEFMTRTADDGTFEIPVRSSHQFTPGAYVVTVIKYADKAGAKIKMDSGLDHAQLLKMGAIENVLLAKYADPMKTDLKAEIQNKDVVVELALKK
jgi:hypothetical protein